MSDGGSLGDATYWIDRRGKLALGLRNWKTVSIPDLMTKNNNPRNQTRHVKAAYRSVPFEPSHDHDVPGISTSSILDTLALTSSYGESSCSTSCRPLDASLDHGLPPPPRVVRPSGTVLLCLRGSVPSRLPGIGASAARGQKVRIRIDLWFGSRDISEVASVVNPSVVYDAAESNDGFAESEDGFLVCIG